MRRGSWLAPAACSQPAPAHQWIQQTPFLFILLRCKSLVNWPRDDVIKVLIGRVLHGLETACWGRNAFCPAPLQDDATLLMGY